MTDLYLLAPVFLLAGFTQGLTGFGAALVAMPLLAFLVDLKMAVPLCVLNGLIINFYIALVLRRRLDRQKIMPLFLGSVPGVAVGAFFMDAADSSLLRIFLGALITSYSLHALFSRRAVKPPDPRWAYAAGFGTGAIATAFSAGGPPAIIYTTLTGWPKDDIKATLAGFFLASGILSASTHALLGYVTPRVLVAFAFTLLFVLVGVAAGSAVYGKIDRNRYLRIVLGFLACAGVMLIVFAP